MRPPLVVITDSDLGPEEIERGVLEPDFELVRAQARTEEEVLSAAHEADGLLVQWAPITAAVLAGLPRLRAVVRYGVGLDNVDLEAARTQGVAVANVPDYCVEEVADHAFSFIAAAARRLLHYSTATRAGGWGPELAPPPLPPADDPVGIVGFGRIGRALARRCQAAGFPVLAWDPLLAEQAFGDVVRVPGLAELAGAVNHLSLHVPGGSELAGLADATVLEALGPSGHLVNTSRGSLVDEDALLAALEAQRLWAASLDVLAREPPAGVSAELARHPRVLVTPHVGYLSTASVAKLRRGAATRIRSLLAGPGSSRDPGE